MSKTKTVSDVYFQMPVSFPAEKGKAERFYLSRFWAHCRPKRTFYTVDYCGDGNHEPIRKRDLPTEKEQRRAWQQYYEFVARTATDPLGSFLLSPTLKVREQWQFKFRSWVGNRKHGLLFVGARKNSRGPWLHAMYLPKDVKDFFLLTKVRRSDQFYTCRDFRSLDSLLQVKDDDVIFQRTGGRLEVKGIAVIHTTKPNPAYKKKLVKLAREWAKREAEKVAAGEQNQ